MFDFPHPSEDDKWMVEGICAQPLMDPDWWFPSKEKDMKEVAEICQRCPVIRQCRKWTLTEDAKRSAEHIWGVAGGMTQRTRRGLAVNGCAGICRTCEALLRRKGVAAHLVPGSKAIASKKQCSSCYRRELKERKKQAKAKKPARLMKQRDKERHR